MSFWSLPLQLKSNFYKEEMPFEHFWMFQNNDYIEPNLYYKAETIFVQMSETWHNNQWGDEPMRERLRWCSVYVCILI